MDRSHVGPPTLPSAGGAPNWRALVAVVVAIGGCCRRHWLARGGICVGSLSRSGTSGRTGRAGRRPVFQQRQCRSPPPRRSRAVIWCRESVPGTQILSTLALIHIATSRRFGDQVVLYEELTKPWVPGGSFRRGVILETEGLGTANSAAPLPSDQEVDDDADLEAASDGLRCASCAPDRLTVAGGEVLVGSCVHGVPLRVGIVYVIAPPVRPGQTPLALHISCGLTSIRAEGDQIVVSGEAPLVRGLYEARFPFPDISFARERGRFVASDLGLLD